VLALLATCICAKEQVTYTYDNNGNRIKRELYLSPPLGERSFTPLHPIKGVPLPDDAAMNMAANFGIRIFPQLVRVCNADARNLRL
jgi:hypothetical protein